jgi:hypothetical protein
MMKNLFTIALLVYFLPLKAQVNTFNKTYRDTLNLSNISSRPVEYPDGVYSIASAGGGLSLSQGSYQRIYQVNQQGELIQNRMEHDLNRTYSGASKLIKSNDENLFLASTRSNLGNTAGNQIFVQKISADLSDTLWSYRNSDSSAYNTTADIIESTNGDVYITARRRLLENDSMLGIFIRLDSQGQIVSEMIIREREVQALESLVQLADGSVLIGGTRGPANSTNLHGFLMKISSQSQILWSHDYTQITECGMSIYGEDQVILSGYIYSLGTAKMLLLDTSGNLVQNKTYYYPGYSAINYIGRKVADGGIISVGLATKLDFTENDNGFIMKTDLNGNMLWQKDYKYTSGDFNEFFTDFIETSDGGLLISGSAIESTADGGQNSWLMKLDADGCLDPANCGVAIEDAPFPNAVTIFPNPATDWLRIDLETAGSAYTAQLLDATGRLVQQEQFTLVGTHTLSLNGLEKGMYYCRILQNGKVITTEKVLKVE